MKKHRPATRILRLAGGQTISTRADRGARIAVVSGCAWLTVERDARDFVLPAGRVFTCADDDVLVVVEMLAAGTLTIEPAGSSPAPQASRSRRAWWPTVAAASHF